MRRAYVIGNGPSLNKIDIAKLSTETTISFNRAYIAYEEWGFYPTYYMCIDGVVLENIKDDINHLIKTSPIKHFFLPDWIRPSIVESDKVTFIHLNPGQFIGTDINNLSVLGNAGACSTQILNLLGYKQIILLGVDCRYKESDLENVQIEHNPEDKVRRIVYKSAGNSDPNHFRADYFGSGCEYSKPQQQNHFRNWQFLAQNAQKYGLQIISSSLDSTLNGTFPYIEFESIVSVDADRTNLFNALISVINGRIDGRWCGFHSTKFEFCRIVDEICKRISEPCYFVEIGTLHGGSAIASMLVAKLRGVLDFVKVICIDPFEGYYNKDTTDVAGPVSPERVKANFQRFGFDERYFELVIKKSNEVGVSCFKDKSIKMLFIDGDHSYEGVKYDWEHFSRLVDDDCTIIFDNYADRINPATGRKVWPDVKKFVDNEIIPNETVEIRSCSSEIVTVSLKQVIKSASCKANYLLDKTSENHLYLFVPSNDTHVQWMHSLAQILDESGFMIVPTRNEKADYYLDKLNIKFFVYQPGILSRIKPSVVIFGNDWGGEEKQIIAEAGQLGINSVCIQEGCLDFMNERSSRMLNADYAFLQGPVMRNYIRRQKNVIVTGNPKYDSLYEMPLPEKITVMINSNFTYGIYEEARDQWVRDVAESCRELGLNFFISQHPRDKGVFPPDYPVFKSDAFKIHLQLEKTSILISRFSTVIYEAAAMGREVIYYNPHREPFRIFAQDQTGGIGIANDRSELVRAIRSTIENLGKNSKNRHKFLTQHCYTLSHDAVVRCAACLQAVAQKDTEALSLFCSLGEQQNPQPSSSDEKRNPVVSVIIPCYNTAEYLAEAINSVLTQTFGDFEIIVVDDGSTDNTADVTASFNDSCIYYVRHPENKGLAAARNTGIRHSKGRYLTFLDADDYFLPHKLKDQVSFLDNYNIYGLVVGGYLRVGKNGEVLKEHRPPDGPVTPELLIAANKFIVHSTLIRREYIEKAGYFDEELKGGEEWDFHCRLALAGCLMYRQNNIVCAYRLVDDSLSTDLKLQTDSRLKVVEKSFGSENLTPELSNLKNYAIAYTHLKAAGQYYSLKQFDRANHHLVKTLTTDPSLSKNNYERVIRMILFYMDLAWIDSPVEYINVIFNSMPAELRGLKKLQKKVAYRALSNRILSSYKDKHSGRRCVIIGSGPSLKAMDLSFLKDEITFGFDHFDLELDNQNFNPTYYICLNPLLIDQNLEKIQQMTSTRFLSDEVMPFIRDSKAVFLTKTNKLTFVRDPENALSDARTTTYIALQLACFMGFEEAILIGNDHNLLNSDKKIIQMEGNENETMLLQEYSEQNIKSYLTDLEKAEVAYQMARTNYESEGRRIIDATVNSKLEIFPKADYRRIFFSTSPNADISRDYTSRKEIESLERKECDTKHIVRWGNLWDEPKPDGISILYAIASSYLILSKFDIAGTLFEKIHKPLQDAIDGNDFTACMEFINRSELAECFVSTCTKLAQCYAKQGAWYKVKQIYINLLNRKNLKLPEVQKQDILNVLKKLENIKIPQNGLQAEGTIFSQKILNLRSQGKNQQSEQISNEIRSKVEGSSFIREPSKAKSLVTHPACPPKRFSEVALLLKLNYPLNRKNTVVDVGAHTGFFAKPFAKRGWQVIAFEPEPNNYKEFCCNLQSFPDVVCIKKAVFDTSADRVPFYVSSEHWGIHSLKPFHSTHRLEGTVETVRLDEVLAQSQIDHVTILKIDIEGADFMALRSFDFSRFQPEVVICEYMDERSEPNFGFTHHDMAAYMAHLGYVTFVSEYAPIVEYGRKGIATAPHKFLRCERYPLDSNPAWGNLIFVPQAQAEQFEQTLSAYLNEIGASTATLQLSSSPQTQSSTAQEISECFVSTRTKLAQSYAKQGAWDKVKQIYLDLLNRKNLKLPEVQKQDILNVLKKLENVKIPKNAFQAETIDSDSHYETNTLETRNTSVSEPLVSVIMPAYNAEEYISQAIESVLAQSYSNFELIIINDGSTDNTEQIIHSFNDQRIRYFKQSNQGLAATHNFGIKQSRGEFVIKLDADDMMTPDFIARHLQEFEEHPEAHLIYCDDCLVDKNGEMIKVMEYPEYSDRKSLIRDLFRSGYTIVPFRTCIRKSIFDKLGYFDETLAVGEDYDMMRRFVKLDMKIHHLNNSLYLRRMGFDSLSRNYTAQKVESLFEILRRFVDTFTYDELFPDVAWEKIPPERRPLHAKCLVAATYLSMAQFHVNAKSSPFYIKVAFEKAWSQLNDCMKMDPNNYKIRELMDKCELGRKRHYQQVQYAVV